MKSIGVVEGTNEAGARSNCTSALTKVPVRNVKARTGDEKRGSGTGTV